MTRLIGLIGAKGSGKTTAAQVFEELGYKRIPFAKPIKDMFRALGVSEIELNGSFKETPTKLLSNRSPRYGMQTLGDWGRQTMHPDFWVNIWFENTKRHLYSSIGNKVIVDDCRYQNEAELIRKLGGSILLISRKTEDTDTHSSEQEFKKIEYNLSIPNDRSLEDFRELIRTIGG